jgi:hypothetical protein
MTFYAAIGTIFTGIGKPYGQRLTLTPGMGKGFPETAARSLIRSVAVGTG